MNFTRSFGMLVTAIVLGVALHSASPVHAATAAISYFKATKQYPPPINNYMYDKIDYAYSASWTTTWAVGNFNINVYTPGPPEVIGTTFVNSNYVQADSPVSIPAIGTFATVNSPGPHAWYRAEIVVYSGGSPRTIHAQNILYTQPI